MAKYCIKCGARLEDDVNVCAECGKQQEKMTLVNDLDRRANKGYKLGLWSIVAWLIPLAGYIVSIMGIVNSSKGLKSDEYASKAKVGLVLSIIFLAATIANHIFSTFDYINNMESIAGVYIFEETKIVLDKSGECDIKSIIEDSSNCTWTNDFLDNKITINYKQKDTNKTIEVEIDKDSKSFIYENNKYILK